MASSDVTIVDIAHALGISKTAVSSALHGRGRVSDETRQRVLAQAEAMGYVSNRAAQRLRGGMHGAIGLDLPADLRELAFYMEFAFGVADVAAAHGHDLLLRTAAAANGTRPHVDGLLVVDPTPKTFPAAIAGLGAAPIVAVGEYRGDGHERVAAWVAADHRRLTAEVLDTLAARGAGVPALGAISEARAPLWAQQVVEGYTDWCAARGIDPLVHRVPVTPSDAEIAAVLTDTAAAGRGALLWVAQSVVPHALALQAQGVGAGVELATMAAEPGPARVVGVDLRPRAYGRAAAELLLRVIDGDGLGEQLRHEAAIVTPA
ncbi:LacI family DNA-binding transcriptional regulator [Leucobacter luti]|uniref:DNA-binding LacI/PurR family transcriptional regulator n=1 Tax=Leucobacter luti TaxID=340320 RepID=A0A4Q7U247_9MICO|nr:LacI family DNA-binding transcriptional regulator [Leucobacter luti]MBL3699046.1 LacI family transcriptional regulator [Leucobacter luti]RZT66548.1 DNA-binding LacI/PurR family transcriptional regulator [Leucobacter luti]